MQLFICAGHHPWEPGAEVTGVLEHDLCAGIVRQIVLRLRRVQPVLVPAVPLPGKIDFVNRWSRAGDYALEVHANAFGDPAVEGMECYYVPGSVGGELLAKECLSRLEVLGRQNRGAKFDTASQHASLAFLRDTKPWAALIELEFMTNPGALAWLQGRGGVAAARSIAEAVDGIA